jgi:predicted hydrocarbon binding protein
MIVTRHISIDNDCIRKMEPFVAKHSGNFSAAIRDIIDHIGKSGLPNNSTAVDVSIFKWMLDMLDCVLVPDGVLDEMIDPVLINSMRKLEEHLNYRFRELEWNIDLSLKCDNDRFPSDVMIEIKGDTHKIRLAACILSQYLVKNSNKQVPLEIKSVSNLNDCIKIELFSSNKKEAMNSLKTFFGEMEEVTCAIKSRPDFWKSLVNRHVLSDYNMVTVHRNYFEDLLANNIPLGEISIENIAKKPIQDIPLKEMLSLIKEVYETSRVVDRVEIEKDRIVLFHNYRNKDTIDKLKKILVTLLEANGHLFDAKSTANMIVLTHRPDVGSKVNEIVDNLRISNSRVDQELIMFTTFLKGLKEIPDISLSLTALGRRFGKSLMQEYEKENQIKTWDLKSFKNAFEMFNSKLHIDSEWKMEGKNLLYTIKKCNIANEGNKFDTFICHTSRETFKGAVNYAFGNGAELEIKKLLSHGDNFCEVVIKLM